MTAENKTGAAFYLLEASHCLPSPETTGIESALNVPQTPQKQCLLTLFLNNHYKIICKCKKKTRKWQVASSNRKTKTVCNNLDAPLPDRILWMIVLVSSKLDLK